MTKFINREKLEAWLREQHAEWFSEAVTATRNQDITVAATRAAVYKELRDRVEAGEFDTGGGEGSADMSGQDGLGKLPLVDDNKVERLPYPHRLPHKEK